MILFRPRRRVLLVCSANVCRSPLAEALLRHHLRQTGMASRVEVRSAGSCVGQRGRRPDPRVEKLTAEAGISLGRVRARMLSVRMVQRSDYVLVMEHIHLVDVARLLQQNTIHDNNSRPLQLPDKVQLLGSFLPRENGCTRDIPDPYFGNWQGFVEVYELIDTALANFSATLARDLDIL